YLCVCVRRDSLLGAIQGGVQLRKATQRKTEPRRQMMPRDALLAAIRGPKVLLREIDRSELEARQRPATGPCTISDQIKALMDQRRDVLDDDSDDSDSEWSDADDSD
ncbi:MAG: hypothetical protein MHM6MM_005662, partial [Cercozoa sp. M6MM]